MDLILTGRMMDAAEAERAGLVARVVPAASLMEEAMKVAETIAAMSLPSVYAAKESVNRAFETSLAEGVRFERRVFHALFATRRPEGRHGGVRREAAGEVQEQVVPRDCGQVEAVPVTAAPRVRFVPAPGPILSARERALEDHATISGRRSPASPTPSPLRRRRAPDDGAT